MSGLFSSMFGQPASTYLQGQGPLANYGLNWGVPNPTNTLVNNTNSDWFSLNNLFGNKNQVGVLP